jgi:cell wall-associated NlpC family hydrolase
LADKQRRLDEFIAQLDELDRELSLAAESYNEASDRLASLRTKVTVAESDLRNAREAYQLQMAVLGRRASSEYKEGPFAAIEILLDADSMRDLVARVQFINTIGTRDADIAEALKGQQDSIEQQVATLKTDERVASSLEFEMKARKLEVQLRITERQAMYATAKSDLLKMLASEAARRQDEEAALLADIHSGTSAVGINVEPGTPVETALAYHGIPYLWGGETPAGFDCSGLILYTFAQHGVSLPHYSGSQFLLGDKVAYGDLQPNDVVFFGSPIHHVGLYVGGGYFLHAPRTGDFIKISRLADRSDFAGARRYTWQPRVGEPLGGVSTTAQALSTVR